MPDRMPEDMPEHMPDRMPNRMPEDMSDRMPQDLPVRKCINVMVGITQSKVIVFSLAFSLGFGIYLCLGYMYVYVVFVAFSWGKLFFVAAAFLSVTSVRCI